MNCCSQSGCVTQKLFTRDCKLWRCPQVKVGDKSESKCSCMLISGCFFGLLKLVWCVKEAKIMLQAAACMFKGWSNKARDAKSSFATITAAAASVSFLLRFK